MFGLSAGIDKSYSPSFRSPAHRGLYGLLAQDTSDSSLRTPVLCASARYCNFIVRIPAPASSRGSTVRFGKWRKNAPEIVRGKWVTVPR
jgi:hypothetical protein